MNETPTAAELLCMTEEDIPCMFCFLIDRQEKQADFLTWWTHDDDKTPPCDDFPQPLPLCSFHWKLSDPKGFYYKMARTMGAPPVNCSKCGRLVTGMSAKPRG